MTNMHDLCFNRCWVWLPSRIISFIFYQGQGFKISKALKAYWEKNVRTLKMLPECFGNTEKQPQCVSHLISFWFHSFRNVQLRFHTITLVRKAISVRRTFSPSPPSSVHCIKDSSLSSFATFNRQRFHLEARASPKRTSWTNSTRRYCDAPAGRLNAITKPPIDLRPPPFLSRRRPLLMDRKLVIANR